MSATPPSFPAITTFLEALADGLPAGGCGPFPVVVGVSGGADSVALLLGLVQLGLPEAARLVVAHAEHDLREAAGTDREFVRSLAADLGLPCSCRRLAVRASAPGGEGLEARARRLRYAFLAEVAHEVGARYVLVAHTADDQAETVLHRVLRGTGLTGLGGMRRARELCDGVALLRPLLGVSRAAAKAFLAAVAADWREDATNADTSRARNFLRHEVLPRCVAGPYPAAPEALVRLAGQAAAAAAVITAAAERLLDEHAQWPADGAVVLRTRPLADLDPHLLAEVFVTVWRRRNWPRRDMTAGHFAGLASLVRPSAPHGTVHQFPGGIRAVVCGPDLVLARP